MFPSPGTWLPAGGVPLGELCSTARGNTFLRALLQDAVIAFLFGQWNVRRLRLLSPCRRLARAFARILAAVRSSGFLPSAAVNSTG